MKPTKQFRGLINYKPSSGGNPRNNDDSSSTSSIVEDNNKQRIEFVHHKLTSLLLRMGDMVLIIVPEEFEILQTLDPMLHGKVGTIVRLDSMEDEECEDLIQVEIENKKTNSIDHTITRKQCEIISVPKFCVCLKAEIFNERKERYLNQRRARSCDTLSTSTTSSTSSDISQSLTSMLSTTRSLSPDCYPSASGNLSSLLVSPTKHASSPPTTTTNSCSPKYSLGPKKTSSVLNRQKRFHSTATVPPQLLSSTSTFFQSSTTTQVVGNNKRPMSSPAKTNKKNTYQTSTNSQFSSKRSHDYSNDDVDMRDNFLSQSVPKYINSFMLSDFESSNIFSADIPSENVNRHRQAQDSDMNFVINN